MNKLILLVCVFILAACASPIPYRTAGFDAQPQCQKIYDQYIDNRLISDPDDPCWQRSIEERDDYDLLFAEFDDQGWIQNTYHKDAPAKKDHLEALFDRLNDLIKQHQAHGISLVLFIHGWHHNAQANDANVREFRELLEDTALVEGEKKGRRVVGLYVGWRGESVTAAGVNMLTFWERKSVAERVAQGSVRELFARLGVLRAKVGSKAMRMITIGHSFGGLITFQALSSEFIRSATMYNENPCGDDDKCRFLSRFGDLVVIVNPAFEGARYEPLKVAGQRLKEVSPTQMPIVIVATTQADWATGVAFPAARILNPLFESVPDVEQQANLKTVGHNARYTTHHLSVCGKDEVRCPSVCQRPVALSSNEKNRDQRRQHVTDEATHMAAIAKRGIRPVEYLCDGLKLTGTPEWTPLNNPYWVVDTSKYVMEGHNDIFNPNFVAFVRHMYALLVNATEQAKAGIQNGQ